MAEIGSKGMARMLRIFIGEGEHLRGKPLHEVIVLKAKQLGLAGATVSRGFAGFGAGSRAEGKRPLQLSRDETLMIEIIDHPDRIAEAAGPIAEMVNKGLVVTEDVQVIKYAQR